MYGHETYIKCLKKVLIIICILRGHVLYFWWPCGKMLDKRESLCKLLGHIGRSACQFGGHIKSNYVNFVPIWPSALPDLNFLNKIFKINFLNKIFL